VPENQLEWDTDTVCSLLGHELRRAVLRCLMAESGPVALDDLSEKLAGADHRTGADERLQVRLHHMHLPKLAEENAIAYDRDTAAVSITRDGRRLVEYLDEIESRTGLQQANT